MHISIKNLGIIETADIELSGITVLSGYNDSGKSFIGKLIFSIVNTIKNAALFDETGKVQQFIYTTERIRITHRRVIPPNMSRIGLTLSVDEFGEHLLAYFMEYKFRDPTRLIDLIDKYQAEISLDLEGFNEKNSRVKSEDLEQIRKDVEVQFNLLKLLANERKEDESLYISYFQTVIINGIFSGDINTIGNNSTLDIKIIEGSTVIVSISIENNRVSSFKYNSELNPLFKDDAILIETPTIISLDKYFYPIGRSPMRDREFPVQYHDLLIKMSNNNNISPAPYSQEIADIIKAVIKGEVIYDVSERSFVYKKNNQDKISSSNIATGIKSFALLQMLNVNGYFTPDTILILDEPEVHLHPEWEIVYARILFELCKAGVYILLTTHSTYFVQAIVKYAGDMAMENKVHFYFGSRRNKKTNLTTFTDVTDDLNPIFKALGKPMQDIYNQ